jgi:SAM-dependent methyltransferase
MKQCSMGHEISQTFSISIYGSPLRMHADAPMTRETSLEHGPISRESLRSLLIAYRAENWKGIQTAEMQLQIVETMLEPNAEPVLEQVAQFLTIPPRARILDIGSGVGGFVTACQRLGYRAFGVEPDRIGIGGSLTSIQIASRRVAANVFAAALGEALPFGDRMFDLVSLNQVVEHVADQMAVLREAARVVRPGGAIYVACPNYLRFHEPHYKVFWFPFLPRPLARLYLSIRGRSTVMLQQLHYTTNRRLRIWLEALGDEFQIFDLHQEQVKRKCCGKGRFESFRGRFVQKLVSLHLAGPLVMKSVLFWLRFRERGCEMLVLRKDRRE